MSKAEFIKNIEKCDLNIQRIKEIEKKYKTNLTDFTAHAVSYADEQGFFDEERRALSYSEILNPIKFLKFDFIKAGLIPIVDTYDNTYVVYAIDEGKWAKFSLSDRVLFKKKDTFKEVV